jgi:hypothetical protein
MAGPCCSEGPFKAKEPGVAMKAQPMGMPLMMPFGWIDRHRQDVIGKSMGKTL